MVLSRYQIKQELCCLRYLFSYRLFILYERGTYWMNVEDIYDVENEMGIFVRVMREAKGYNQEEISDGICSLTTLSRIEKGEREVDFLLIEVLLDRMKVEKTEYEFVLDNDEYDVYEQREEILSFILEKQYEKAKEKLVQYETKYAQDRLHQQFVFWQRGLLLIKELQENKEIEEIKKLEKKKAIKEILLKAIVITAPEYERKFQEREVLSNIELSCITGMFYCIEHDKEREEALKELYQYFKWCKKREKLYPIPYRTAMQYYAECLYRNKKYVQCKQICIEALEELSFTSKLENRAEFFYLKAKAQEKIGFWNEEEKNQCIKDFLTAYYVIAFYDGEVQAEPLKKYIKETYAWQFIE